MGEMFPTYDSSYTGKFSKMLFLKRRQSGAWRNHCGEGAENSL